VSFIGLLSFFAAFGQNSNGRISGTVTDPSGGAVPKAAILLTNTETTRTWKAVSDTTGFYSFAELPVGTYTVAAEASGFHKTMQSGLELQDQGRLTVDFKLQVGSTTETVQVSANIGEAVNTVSGEVSHLIDSEQVQDLALNGRNYMQLVTLMPGVAVTSLDQMAMTSSLSVGNQSINGGRTDSQHLAVDGGMNLDSGSNTSQINNVGVDFVQQVKVQTSSFSAELGRNSGANINVVTKAGTSHFHGSLFEVVRNDVFDATSFFSPVKPALRFNDWGYSIGGPVPLGRLKNRLFFFGGEEWKRIRHSTNASRQTLPTQAEMNGDFSDRTTTSIYYPGTKNPIPNKDLSSLMTPDGKAIMAVYKAMATQAAVYTSSTASNNATYQVPNPFDFREDILRVDFRPTDSQTIYIRYLHDMNHVIDPFGTFNASSLPTTPDLRNRPAYGPQFGHIWTITPSIVNEFKINGSWNSQHTPLQGDSWARSTYGFQFPLLYGPKGSYPGGIPDVTVTSFASFNGPARVYLQSPVTDMALSDSVTYIHGRHTVKAGLQFFRNRKDQNGRTIYDGSITFNTSGNPNTTNYALADAAVGEFNSYSEASNDPTGFFRFTQIESYIQDSWKVTNRLSLEIGLRTSYFVPTFTAANNMSNFVPSLYDPKQAVTVTSTGAVVAGSGNPYNGLIRAGNGIPSDQAGRVTGINQAALAQIPTGAPRGLYTSQNLYMPRFSFAYSLSNNNKTVLRGGFGTFHDRTQGNLIFSQTALPPFTSTAVFNYGLLSNPGGGTAAALAPMGTIHAIDPNLKVPSIYTYNFGLQRELPFGMFLDVTYAGTLGRHLLRSPNINEPTFAQLEANQQLTGTKPVTNSFVPYLGYSTINEYLSDATSNYNALQTYVTKRRGNLVMTASYTWSKALTDASAYNEAGDVIEWSNPKFNYGPASFDRRHIFAGTYTYRIPFFRGTRGVLGAAVARWELSGIMQFQTGPYLTPTGSTAIGTRRSDYLGGSVSIDNRGPNLWFNTAAFATAPDGRLGYAGAGIIEGPNWFHWDVSLRKQFAIRERATLRFQADAFNVTNRVNFDSPNVTTSSTSFGTISGSEPARNLQFGARLVF
jgi:hypothetical protein